LSLESVREGALRVMGLHVDPLTMNEVPPLFLLSTPSVHLLPDFLDRTRRLCLVTTCCGRLYVIVSDKIRCPYYVTRARLKSALKM